MSMDAIRTVLRVMKAEGYSAENCAFGMGGGLLQKVNRDTMSFATKLSHIVYADGRARDVMKAPQADPGKISLPGKLAVKRINAFPTVFAAEDVPPEENLMQVYYDGRPKRDLKWERFSEMRERVKLEWMVLASERNYNPIHASLQSKIDSFVHQSAGA